MTEPSEPTNRPADGRPPGLPIVGSVVRLVVAGVVVLAVLVGALGIIAGWLPSLNPFREETVDRTGPSVLMSLNDLSEYRAASAHYETVVDIENPSRFLPDFVSGERVLYVGKGDVDAIVDFGELDERRVTLSADRTSATIKLPAPIAGKPVLDLENSYVANYEKGLLNTFRGSDLEREAQLRAVAQMSTATTGEDMLIDRAKENTASMLRGLLGALGFTDITITFDDDPR